MAGEGNLNCGEFAGLLALFLVHFQTETRVNIGERLHFLGGVPG